MKTILVTFTKNKIDDVETLKKRKGYSFNTDAEVKQLDIIVTDDYSSYLQVIEVMDDYYKYYNYKTGELSKDENSGSWGEIKTLIINKLDGGERFYGYTR